MKERNSDMKLYNRVIKKKKKPVQRGKEKVFLKAEGEFENTKMKKIDSTIKRININFIFVIIQKRMKNVRSESEFFRNLMF